MSPQYHSASCSVYAGGERQLLFMVEDTGFVDLGGSATRKRERDGYMKRNANHQEEQFLRQRFVRKRKAVTCYHKT